MTNKFAVILSGLLVAGCDAAPPTRPVLSPPELVTAGQLALVRAAPDSVVTPDATLRLSTYLWRDFMPVAAPDGEPLRAVLWIATADSSAFPPGLRADAAWVVKDHEVWATWLRETRPRAAGDSTLEVFAEGGPKWGPGIEVDVVVRLREAADAAWYLRAGRQAIVRTD